LACWFWLCGGVAQGAEVPALKGPLNDYAHVAGSLAPAIEQKLAQLHRDTGVQWVVLTLPTLDQEPIAPFAHRVMEAWKLGAPGSDLGLLLLIVPQDRQTRLEVGYGLEGVLPDALAKRMLAEVLAPKPRAGAPAQITGEQILATVAFGEALIRKQQALGLLPQATPAVPQQAAAPSADLILYLVLALGAALLLAGWLMSRMQRYPEHEAPPEEPGWGRRAHASVTGPSVWGELFRLLLIFLGGGRGGPPPGGGGYSGGGGRSGGGGASDKY